MPDSFGRRWFLASSLGLALFASAGCDKDGAAGGADVVEGEYQTVHGETVVALDGKTATIKNWKASRETKAPYTAQGDKITLQAPGGSVVLTRSADGSLTGVPEKLSGLPASTVLKKPAAVEQ